MCVVVKAFIRDGCDRLQSELAEYTVIHSEKSPLMPGYSVARRSVNIHSLSYVQTFASL